MSKFLCLCFLLANYVLCIAMANTNQTQISVTSISIPSTNPPAESPYNGRKLGKHQNKQLKPFDSPSPSPSEAPQSEKKVHSIPSHQRTSVEPKDEETLGSQGQVVHLVNHHHHSFDKSIAGGGVILGGLATTFLVSVFCYIRATGRHKSAETTSNV